MLIAGVFYLLLFAFSYSKMISQPWIGIDFQQTEIGSARVTDIAEQGPAWQLVSTGDLVRGLACAQGSVLFNRYSFIEDPEENPTFRDYQAFFEHQRALSSCLAGGDLRLLLSDGVSPVIHPLSQRPFLEIPVGFWITHLLGVSTLILAVGIWSHRRGKTTSRLLLLWSVSVCFIVNSMVVYGFRELAIAPELFLLVHSINRFSVMILGFTIFILICYYPTRLTRFPIATLLLPVAVLLALAERFALIEWPWHTFYFVLITVYLSAFITLSLQWRRSRDSAINRAAVLWFIWSIVLSNGGSVAFYALPTVFGEPPLTSLWIGQGFLLLMFFGFALGVIRYRLFEIEQWWIMTWIWFLGGLLVIVLDSLLIVFLNLTPAGALSISVLLVAWAYLPARQWLWQRLFKRNDYRLETYLPQFIDAQFSAADAEDFNNQWPGFLAHIFHCADVTLQPGRLDDLSIESNGYDLRLPAIGSEHHVILTGKERGTRLFTLKDVRLVRGLYELANRTMSLRMEQEKAVNAERDRIMRDLHDDIGAQLLALVHLSEGRQVAEIARGTLTSLREMVYAFRRSKGVRLAEMLPKWREELMQRSASTEITAHWAQEEIPALNLSARQSINLGSIFREAVSNALKHPNTTELSVQVRYQHQQLLLTVSNNGIGQSSPADWPIGAGRANMSTRAAEIDATITWTLNPVKPDTVDVEVNLPLEQQAT